MNVVKYTVKYTVRHRHEGAHIFVEHGRNATSRGHNTWLILACNSSLGNFGYAWHHCGDIDWREFLFGSCERYIMDKIAPDLPDQFDLVATRKALKDTLLQSRYEGNLTKDEARYGWDELKYVHDEQQAYEWLDDFDPNFDGCPEEIRFGPHHLKSKFWRDIWLPWMEILKAETQAELPTEREAEA